MSIDITHCMTPSLHAAAADTAQHNVNRRQLDLVRGALIPLLADGLVGALRPDGLGKLAREVGLGSFAESDIVGLWRMGLLRADMIRADHSIDRPDLTLLTQDGDGALLYLDTRVIENRSCGHGGALQPEGEDSDDFELWFHPFRLYVLSHVTRTLKVETSNTQYLMYPNGVLTVAKQITEHLDHWTSSVAFGERFDHWNATAELAVVCEPFIDVRRRLAVDEVSRNFNLTTYLNLLNSLLLGVGRPYLQAMREELGWHANTLDGNRDVQVLLRLMLRRNREKVNGVLGAALKFLSMAEAIRRAAEDALGVTLPEEDEIGPGQWMDGARKVFYGTDRVFDADRRDLRDYMRLLGLDFGTTARCYVEGPTEFGAISQAMADSGHVELVNLAGQVNEGRRKGLAFVEGLENDFEARVFSVILLDNDRADHVKAVKKAAREKRFFGRFFLSQPDIEFGSFSSRELVDISLSLTRVDELDPDSREARRLRLYAATARSVANSELWSALAAEGIHDVNKGEEWGKALMTYANQHPQREVTGDPADHVRPIVELARLLLRTRDAGFMRSVAQLELDPDTGLLVRKQSTNAP